MYSSDFKAELLASLLQSHDPSEIIHSDLMLKTFIIIIIMLRTAE